MVLYWYPSSRSFTFRLKETVTMRSRGVGLPIAVGLFRTIPLVGLLEFVVASNAYPAFQFPNNKNAASCVVTASNNRKPSMHRYASMQDSMDLAGKRSSSRRNVLLTALSGVFALGASTIVHQPFVMQTSASSLGGMTVDEAIAWIDEHCDRRFLHAVVASDYHFLYRGVSGSSISIINEKPDLLLPETYGSQDAIEFFRRLEIAMKDDMIRPSNGHLATTSAEDAAAWGTTAASIWPMAAGADENVHYAWFQDGGLFYPRNDAQTLDRKQIIVDGRDCGRDSLDDALTKDSCEVIVSATRGGYLAVPVSMEKELRDRLRNSFLV
jgi:hypothetical protein